MNHTPIQTELDRILIRLFERAMATPGQEYKTKLHGALIISMTVEEGPLLHLAIHRPSIYPSEREWKTVLEHMPWPCSSRPQMMADNKLSARLSIHPKLL